MKTIESIKEYISSLPSQILKPEKNHQISNNVTVHYLNEFGVIGPDGSYFLYENLTSYELAYIYNHFVPKFGITFSVTGTMFQDITILNGESKEDFFRKIKTGEYFVSLISNMVYDFNGNHVGNCETTDVGDDSDYFDFELAEEI